MLKEMREVCCQTYSDGLQAHSTVQIGAPLVKDAAKGTVLQETSDLFWRCHIVVIHVVVACNMLLTGLVAQVPGGASGTRS